MIGENKFRIPFMYALDIQKLDGIELLIGCNFIRSMYGGVRIEGTSVTFYKNVTTINTSMELETAKAAIAELDRASRPCAEHCV